MEFFEGTIQEKESPAKKVKLDNSTDYRDFDITEIGKPTGITIQMSQEEDYIEINGVKLIGAEKQMLIDFINFKSK